ncbi:circadian clock protein KaiC [Archaeoglobus veneficus]|uniref:Putative KaiC associated regulatory domain protein n=1 Tax=Archaeoglobus veneficus (strain DSM 11195 / SNP6) TaxID=693661 RepID=F2KRK9_ARCVS|nr:circadian clock protein KaiC [Archaeoglobus veneficus]AEA46774.1 putative KaiC associated regulatory domain protein [Archaeoglobus veneficus SNP6]
MEVIAKPKGGNIDKMAEKVFMESINLLGGLKKLVEYRNLTWLPSLAEAAYVIVLKNEAFKTYGEIAKELGITEQTARNVATADEEKVKEYIEGRLEEKPNEHIAGGIAKLAYRKLKEEGRLEEEEVVIRHDEIEVLGIDWAVHVLVRIKGLDFPVGKEQLAERLEGMVIKGKNVEEILDKLEYPVKSPAELLHKIKLSLEE